MLADKFLAWDGSNVFGHRSIVDVIGRVSPSNKLRLRRLLRSLAGARQASRFFPIPIKHIYSMMEQAGFSPSGYRNTWPDLIAALPSETWSASHFVEFMETEVKTPRRFPIDINFEKLDKLSRERVLLPYYKASLVRNVLQAQIDYNNDSAEDPVFWLHTINILSQIGYPVVVFGDSHSLIYRQTVTSLSSNVIIPLTILCGGGSAAGLPNIKSRSGYGNRIRRITAALNEAVRLGAAKLPVLFAFGQVDLEFVHTFRRLRAKKFDFEVAALEQFTLDFSKKYVDWVVELSLAQPVIVGINPPCLDDQYISDAYLIQMQTYVHASIVDSESDDHFGNLMNDFQFLKFQPKKERTATHQRLNALLRQEAGRVGLLYVDIFSKMLGDDLCIKPSFACASEGGLLHVGLTGKDIHVGGKFARDAKASLLRSLPKLAATAYHTPS